ncbi:hypothetical protein AOQ71_31940 [Bradyrhizobium manausense]|uniref:Uncharacterized protein n=1 Tax=Bradyrhizobium manausense TaxID=989370 RepID=A0A0R3D0I9_9BRAD|nr:hypothetical protein AOQ71_31940 [Bradyrhizobium manausense]
MEASFGELRSLVDGSNPADLHKAFVCLAPINISRFGIARDTAVLIAEGAAQFLLIREVLSLAVRLQDAVGAG